MAESSRSRSSFDPDPRRLDAILQQFYAELRKEDGSEYEPDSLRVMLASLDRHFQEKGSPFSIRKDKAFEASRQTLNGKAIELREAGLGKRKNKADPLTEEVEETLWSTGVLGGESPTSLSHTMFYVLSQQFGTRGIRSTTRCKLIISNVSGTRCHRESGTPENLAPPSQIP